MRDVDGVEPIVVRASLVVANLGGLEEGRHDHRVEVDAVVVRADEKHGGGVVPGLVELQGVQVDGVQQVEREPGVLHHGLLRVDHGVVPVLLSVVRGIGLPLGAVGGVRRALEPLDDGLVPFAQALHGLGVHDGLVHCDLAEHGQLLHYLLKQLGLVAECVAAMRVFSLLLRVLVVGGCVLFLLGHIGHGLEDRGSHLPYLHQQLLQRPQDDRGHGVREDQGKANHQDHDHKQEHDVHQRIQLVRPPEVELRQQGFALQPDGVRRSQWRTLVGNGRHPREQLGYVIRQAARRLFEAQSVRVIILVLVERAELRELPLELTRLQDARALEHIEE
mmetsp:Transcript_98260/g.300457  ORF Transcript_98260/g.300457 Transcript_98260/m.300457 type:complete len:333 (+) Transcript_98260:877-1875(+)